VVVASTFHFLWVELPLPLMTFVIPAALVLMAHFLQVLLVLGWMLWLM